MRHQRYLQVASQVARSNPNTKWKMAALIVKGGRILSIGQNTEQTVFPDAPSISRSRHPYLTRHAEIDVFRYRPEYKEIACNVYVARVTSGEPQQTVLAKPCDDCLSWLLHYTRARRVFWTVSTDSHFSVSLSTLRRWDD